MDQARRALTQFAFAEGLLVRIATHLHQGTELVDEAHTATRQAMTLVTHWREGVNRKGGETFREQKRVD